LEKFTKSHCYIDAGAYFYRPGLGLAPISIEDFSLNRTNHLKTFRKAPLFFILSGFPAFFLKSFIPAVVASLS